MCKDIYSAYQDLVYSKESKCDIISKVAYLIGVKKAIFENEAQPPQLSTYQALELNKNARIIRNLCMLRNAFEHNYGKILDMNHTQYIYSPASMPELIPGECITGLSNDGVRVFKKMEKDPVQYIIELNKLICDRINNCKSVFPDWLKWDYVKELFVMPEGLSKSGAQKEAGIFYENKSYYPYSVYINWPAADHGNILYNDRKFVELLYQWHMDYFTDFSKVSDAGETVKGSIYDFIDASGKLDVVVDCENSDPYRLYATFRNLDAETTSKISKILLFDDIHTGTGWDLFDEQLPIEVEHIEISRLKQEKSLVDMTLTARCCKEYYKEGVDSFIIVSSDSDYWALIQTLNEARYLVMVEHEKCGIDMRDALAQSNIFYCYIDDFYSGNSQDLALKAMLQEVEHTLADALQLNIYEVLNKVLTATRAGLSTVEKTNFVDKYLRTLQLNISADGAMALQLKNR